MNGYCGPCLSNTCEALQDFKFHELSEILEIYIP